ncbi:hypothetical protein N7492_003362 [Penicillium capsulatum]|uniref:Secreted protein n=1 Tax=Penicillium capsulatum TaxID=69766 RepID=A0A9W9ILS0_9EURO|nr:hypothetical protein N7492_003362 [Penicillium capsulatum]KAJ6122053.1 hypothetical protein N7512_004518 [Penicillium capsulatum]
MLAKTISLPLLALACLVSSENKIKPRSSSDSYSLYAYGDSIGGFPMFYADGNAVVGNQHPSNATKVDKVSFTPGNPGDPMVGNPANATSSSGKSKKSSTPAFSNQSLFVPSANSTDHQVGFTDNGSSSKVTNKFIWYGHFLLVETESGEYTSLFYAKKSGQDDVFSLQWNITDEDDEGEFISVSMRSIPPSNEE